ncbi:Putative serine/threonine-protein kinase/receptor R831 [Rhizoctonia solani]|uniref:Putative serine/threonine-protein kinase/receptor R831 n=1 Tax=Rhizoctonia solani TaxID=456999 RepID=A0A0K6FYX3_9AGAM|nr:Putative serine/threonine-protein kinase/receptor R831 [Rhizoctonia solani]
MSSQFPERYPPKRKRGLRAWLERTLGRSTLAPKFSIKSSSDPGPPISSSAAPSSQPATLHLLDVTNDQEEVIERYRPIEGLFRQLQHSIDCSPNETDVHPQHAHPLTKSHQVLRKIIDYPMQCADVARLLMKDGCSDLTASLKQSACSDGPIVHGGSGDVFYGNLRDGTPVAIKTIRDSHGSSKMGRLYHNIKEAAKEIYTWSKCRHTNIVKLMGLAMFRGCLAMISRWEENGNLSVYLSRYPSANRYQLSESICDGLSYLHDQGITHGDLKGLNVLIDEKGRPMLTDFGNASLKDCPDPQTEDTETVCTLQWAAPEIISGGSRTTPADVYSLGMTILETFTSAAPFAGKRDHSLFKYIVLDRKTPTRPEQFPSGSVDGDNLWIILMKCWSYDPKDRPTARFVRDRVKAITPGN